MCPRRAEGSNLVVKREGTSAARVLPSSPGPHPRDLDVVPCRGRANAVSFAGELSTYSPRMTYLARSRVGLIQGKMMKQHCCAEKMMIQR